MGKYLTWWQNHSRLEDSLDQEPDGFEQVF